MPDGVEEDRTRPLQSDLDELAWPATDQPCGQLQPDRRNTTRTGLTVTAELDEKKLTELRGKLEKQRELNLAWRTKAHEKRTELVAKGKKKVLLHEDRNEKLKAKIQAAQGRNEERGDAVEGRIKTIDAKISTATGDEKKSLEAEKKRLENALKTNEKVEDRLEKAEDKAEKRDDKLDKLTDKAADKAEKKDARVEAKGGAKARTPGPAAPSPQ